MDSSIFKHLAQEISDRFKSHPAVEAIALAGSQTSGNIDRFSDIDLYIYTSAAIPVDFRQSIVQYFGATRADMNLSFWDVGDEWFDDRTGIEVDMIYWDKNWIEEQVDRVLVSYKANVGYTTCFWHTLLHSKMLFDRQKWFEKLQDKCKQPYPDQLRNAIIARNHPVLRNVIPSYFTQIEKAINRNDLISVNHRVAALIASYFDVLFAVNRLTNPGEKKMLSYALEHCSKIPQDLSTLITDIFQTLSMNVKLLPEKINLLIDKLDEILAGETIDPENTLHLK